MRKPLRSTAILAAALLLPLSGSAHPALAATGPKPSPPPGVAALPAPSTVQSDGAAASTADSWAVRPYMGWSSYSMQVYSGNGQWITADQLIKQHSGRKA